MNSKFSTGKRLAAYVAQYKRDALLSPLCTIGCVILEILIPYMTASIIDNGISAGDMSHVAKTGLLMAAMAMLAMFFGVRANQFSARASTGFACNLREAMFRNIKSFSLQDGSYVYKSGTSMSAPIVCGALALSLEKNPNLKPVELKLLLYDSV